MTEKLKKQTNDITVVLTDGTMLEYPNVTNFELYEDSLVLDMPDRQVFILRNKITYYDVIYKEING